MPGNSRDVLGPEVFSVERERWTPSWRKVGLSMTH